MHQSDPHPEPPSPAELPGPQPDETRQRLLRVAGAEFARRGFFEASIRSICDAAGANVSAVKYHFGSKEGLYREVVTEARGHLCSGGELPIMQPGDDPEEALRRWMSWFLELLLVTEEQHPLIGEILAHEMIRPTRFLDEFAQHMGRPIRDEAARIIEKLLPEPAPPGVVRILANGLISLCVVHKHCGEMLTRMESPPPRTPDALHETVGVLVEFAIRGITGFGRKERHA
jgi:Transcriptional regulator